MLLQGSVEPVDSKTGPSGPPVETGIRRIAASWLFDGDRLFVAGGMGDLAPEGDVREFSLQDGTLARTWHLCIPRYLHGEAQIAPARHLLFGGLTGSPEGLRATPAVELLDLRKGTSERFPDLPFATVEPLVAPLPKGRILVAGGYGDDDTLAATAILDIASRTWQSSPPLPSPRVAGPPVQLGPRHILFPGGSSALGDPPLRDGLVLDTATFEWSAADVDLPPGAAIADIGGGRFLACGGMSPEGAPIATVTLWTWTPPLP